ncbi:MAG: Coenzyme PQQ synthesis protein E [Myxococcota bacterium]|nr:Coenzyme PQQ synthesis protein E [Myxococcota bacterium]
MGRQNSGRRRYDDQDQFGHTAVERGWALARPAIKLAVSRALGRKAPYQMSLSLTNRCNFRCDYCEIPEQQRPEMDTQEWRDCIDALAGAGMGRASLMGGEPMVRKDVGEIIRHLKKRGVYATMNTNGWFVADRFDEVAPLDLACVTLDGPREVHDAQRQEGSYSRAIAAIEKFQSAGVKVVTMSVMTPRGAATVDHVLELARDMGFTAFFQIEHDQTMDVFAPVGASFSQQSIASLAETLMARKREGWPIGNSYAVLELQRRDGRRLGGDCSHCYAGRYFGYVMSDGTVAPCLFTQQQQTQGNGRAWGFVEAWNRMNPPRGPGCACVPIHEVNHILSLDPRVLWNAVEMAVSDRNVGIRRL